MYEFFVINKETLQKTVIFGFWYEDACRRWNINPDNYDVIYQDYIDW